MVAKEQLRLGQRVRFGIKMVGAVVDALTRDSCGLQLDCGNYVVVPYEEVYYESEVTGGAV